MRNIVIILQEVSQSINVALPFDKKKKKGFSHTAHRLKMLHSEG